MKRAYPEDLDEKIYDVMLRARRRSQWHSMYDIQTKLYRFHRAWYESMERNVRCHPDDHDTYIRQAIYRRVREMVKRGIILAPLAQRFTKNHWYRLPDRRRKVQGAF